MIKAKFDPQESPMEIIEYDAFTTERGKGNPAGVAYVGDGDLADQDLQNLARGRAFNTVFIFERSGEFRLRYFTPGHEIDLCGHATVAAVGYLNDLYGLEGKEIPVRTNVGRLAVQVRRDPEEKPRVFLTLGETAFQEFTGCPGEIAQALGIEAEELDSGLPLLFGSSGLWTLLVPVKHGDSLKKMVPRTTDFPRLLGPLPRASVHPYCLERWEKEKIVLARHFSSPYSLTKEDPVTGTASGLLGDFLLSRSLTSQALDFTVHQGQEIGRPGQVLVRAQRGQWVTIGGAYVRG